MSDERKEMVKKGFQILDVSKDGRIDMSEMKGIKVVLIDVYHVSKLCMRSNVQPKISIS